MNVWVKAILYVITGFVLGKIANEILFLFLNEPGSGVNLFGAYVPAAAYAMTIAYFISKAFMLFKNKTESDDRNDKTFLFQQDEDLSSYIHAMDEIKSDKKDEGLWIKSFAENNGDIPKTEAAYITARVMKIKKNTAYMNGTASENKAEPKNKTIIESTTPKEKKVAKEKLEYSEKYASYSAEFMIENRFYTLKRYGDREYWLLRNNNAAIKLGDIIYVYINEADCKKSIDSYKLSDRTKIVIKASSIDW